MHNKLGWILYYPVHQNDGQDESLSCLSGYSKQFVFLENKVLC